MKRKHILITVLIVILAIPIIFYSTIQDILLLKEYAEVFESKNIQENFRTLHKQYPSIKIPKTSETYIIPADTVEAELPKNFVYQGKTLSIQEEIKERNLTSLVIIKDGKIAYERYYNGNSKESQAVVFSCTKSVISILTGIAFDEGIIENLNDAAVKYAPELKGTVYENVTIQNLLNMSSGVQWVEDYDDFNSEVVQSIIALQKGSLNNFTKTMKRERKQGTFNKYVSMDTQVLGMVIAGASKQKLEDCFIEKLWSKLGAEYDAYFLLDKANGAFAYAGFVVSARDLAKFGVLMLNGGKNYKGEQIVSKNWVEQSKTPDQPHLQAGRDNPNSDYGLGYKNQWWFPITSDNGDFTAIGIYGQTLYVNPHRNIVIASQSAYTKYNEDEEGEYRRVEMFQAIAKYIDANSSTEQAE